MTPFTPAHTLNSIEMLAPDARATPAPADRRAASHLQQVLQHDPPGSWGADKYAQTNHDTGMVSIAAKAYTDTVAASKPKALERKKSNVTRKSLGIGHFTTDEQYEPCDEDHPLSRIIEEPGGPDGVWEFTQELEFLTLQYLLTGDAPAWCPHNAAGKPVRFFALTSARTQPLFGLGVNPVYPKGAYRVTPYQGMSGFYMGGAIAAGAILPAEEVGRLREMNPWDRSLGMSRLQSGAKEIDVLEAITESRWGMFDHGLQLDTVALLPGIDQDTCDALQKSVQQKQGGAKNSRRFLVLGGGGLSDKFDLKSYGQSAREMDYQQSYDQAAGVVLAFFRVPRSTAGLTNASTYSGLYAEKQQLREYGLIPHFFKLSRFATQTVAKPWNEFPGQYKIEVECPPLGDVEADAKEREFAWTNDLIKKNAYLKATGREPEPDGDVVKSELAAQIQQKYAPPPAPGEVPQDGAAEGEPTDDPLTGLLGGAGDDAGADDTPEGTQDAVTNAALGALGVGAEDDGTVEKAVQTRAEGSKWQVGQQWYTKKNGKIEKTGDPNKARFPSKHNPAATYGNRDDRDADDRASDRDIRTANQAVASARAALQAATDRDNVPKLRQNLAAAEQKVKAANQRVAAARAAVAPVQTPQHAANHDALAAKLLAGRPHLHQITPTGAVHKITGGASLKAFLDKGGKLPTEAALEAAKAVPAKSPVAQQTLATVNQWAKGQADKHADKVAQHFGISREKAHALLLHAITQVAAHAANTGGKTTGFTLTDKRTGKTVSGKPVKPGGEGTPPPPPRPANPAAKGSKPPPPARVVKSVDAQPAHTEGQKWQGDGGLWWVIHQGEAVRTTAPGAEQAGGQKPGAGAEQPSQPEHGPEALEQRASVAAIGEKLKAGKEITPAERESLDEGLKHLTPGERAKFAELTGQGAEEEEEEDPIDHDDFEGSAPMGDAVDHENDTQIISDSDQQGGPERVRADLSAQVDKVLEDKDYYANNVAEYIEDSDDRKAFRTAYRAKRDALGKAGAGYVEAMGAAAETHGEIAKIEGDLEFDRQVNPGYPDPPPKPKDPEKAAKVLAEYKEQRRTLYEAEKAKVAAAIAPALAKRAELKGVLKERMQAVKAAGRKYSRGADALAQFIRARGAGADDPAPVIKALDRRAASLAHVAARLAALEADGAVYKAFDPNEKRDESGEWASGSTGGTGPAAEGVPGAITALEAAYKGSAVRPGEYTPEKVESLLNEVLDGLSDDEVKRVSKQVTGKAGRNAKQARHNLWVDLTAVHRMIESQRV